MLSWAELLFVSGRAHSFSEVLAEPVTSYEKIDSRPQPSNPLADFPPYLTRGLRVSNCD